MNIYTLSFDYRLQNVSNFFQKYNGALSIKAHALIIIYGIFFAKILRRSKFV